LTRYDDCLEPYRNVELSSDKRRVFGTKFGQTPLYRHHTTSLVFNDPPYLTRVRATLAEALKPRAIQPTVAELDRVVARLLDELAARRDVDLIEHFASRVPVEIIATLLTVPIEDRDDLRRWSLAILGALEPELTDAQHAAGEQKRHQRDGRRQQRGHGHRGGAEPLDARPPCRPSASSSASAACRAWPPARKETAGAASPRASRPPASSPSTVSAVPARSTAPRIRRGPRPGVRASASQASRSRSGATGSAAEADGSAWGSEDMGTIRRHRERSNRAGSACSH
jgi:hypothetical protein